MGLLNSLGVNNGLSDFIAAHRGALTNFGVGFANGDTPSAGIGLATQGLARGAVQDDAYATQQKEAQARQDQITATQKALSKYPDLAALAVPGADMGPIISELFKRESPGYGDPNYGKAPTDPANTAPGRQQLADEQGLTGADRATYILTGNLPTPVKPPAPPNGYQPAADGNGLTYIPGGPADPATAGKTTEATRRNQQLAKVIDPEVKSLLGPNEDGNGGTFDALTNGWSQGLDAMGPLGLAVGGGPSGEYQQAKNSLKTIIASYLYSVSGATANPGEVETQASVLTPKPGEPKSSVDEKKKRIATMVQAVKDAAKGTPIAVDDNAAPGGNQTSTGVTWDYTP